MQINPISGGGGGANVNGIIEVETFMRKYKYINHSAQEFYRERKTMGKKNGQGIMRGISDCYLFWLCLCFAMLGNHCGAQCILSTCCTTTQHPSQPVCFYFVGRTCTSVDRRESQKGQDFTQPKVGRSDMASMFRTQRDGVQGQNSSLQLPFMEGFLSQAHADSCVCLCKFILTAAHQADY